MYPDATVETAQFSKRAQCLHCLDLVGIEFGGVYKCSQVKIEVRDGFSLLHWTGTAHQLQLVMPVGFSFGLLTYEESV